MANNKPDPRMCLLFYQTETGVKRLQVVMDFHQRALRRARPGFWSTWRRLYGHERRLLLDPAPGLHSKTS